MAVKFKVGRQYQTKQAIKEGGHLGTEDLIKEYSRLGRLTNARISRLEKKYPRADVLEDMERIPNVKEFLDDKGNIVDWSGFSSAMSSEYRFLRKNTTTIKGFEKQLKRSIDTFNGLYFGRDEETGRPLGKYFNKENIFDLYDFLKDYRDMNDIQKIPDSDRFTDAYVEGVRLNMSFDSLLKDIDFWQEHLGEMRSLEPSDEVVDSAYYKAQLK